MKLKIEFGNGVCSVPIRALSEKGAERTDLLILMRLCAEPALAEDIPALAKNVGCSQKKAESAIEFWLDSGILSGSAAERPDHADATVAHPSSEAEKKSRYDQRPQYDSAEIAAIAERDHGTVRALIDECQRITGKIFTPAETARVVGLVDYLGLDIDHILSLFTYCVRRGKKTVGYIEKTAYNLYDEGIDNSVKLEAYIKKKEEYDSREFALKKIFGITDRALVPKEKELFRKWQFEWNLEDSVIERAYEQAVTKTGRYNLAYMSKIIESWYISGLTTPEKIDSAQTKFRFDKEEKEKQAKAASSSFENDEFVARALKRSNAQQ